MLDHYTADLACPVARDLIYGHFNPKSTLPVGVRARLEVEGDAAAPHRARSRHPSPLSHGPVTLLGLVAACVHDGAFVPQVLKTWRSGSSSDLSLGMYGLLAVGIVLWLVYGVLIRDLPVVLANGVTLLLVLAVLGQALWHRRSRSID